MPQVPDHVLGAFHAPTTKEPAQRMGPAWDNGLKVGDVVYARAQPTAAWSAKVRQDLEVPGARVVRPVLTTDGRFTVAGWKASVHVPGAVAYRVDETVALAGRLEAALGVASAPNGAAIGRDDVFARAEAAAWEETGEAYRELPADTPLVWGHADLAAVTLYSGTAQPAIVDSVPTAARRPKGYTAALVIVDGLIAEAVDEAICDRFSYIPEIDQLLLRAVAYRRHINNLHPKSKAAVRSHIERVESMLVSRAAAIL